MVFHTTVIVDRTLLPTAGSSLEGMLTDKVAPAARALDRETPGARDAAASSAPPLDDELFKLPAGFWPTWEGRSKWATLTEPASGMREELAVAVVVATKALWTGQPALASPGLAVGSQEDKGARTCVGGTELTSGMREELVAVVAVVVATSPASV